MVLHQYVSTLSDKRSLRQCRDNPYARRFTARILTLPALLPLCPPPPHRVRARARQVEPKADTVWKSRMQSLQQKSGK